MLGSLPGPYRRPLSTTRVLRSWKTNRFIRDYTYKFYLNMSIAYARLIPLRPRKK